MRDFGCRVAEYLASTTNLRAWGPCRHEQGPNVVAHARKRGTSTGPRQAVRSPDAGTHSCTTAPLTTQASCPGEVREIPRRPAQVFSAILIESSLSSWSSSPSSSASASVLPLLPSSSPTSSLQTVQPSLRALSLEFRSSRSVCKAFSLQANRLCRCSAGFASGA